MERFGGKKSGYENKMAATRFPVAIIHWINVGGNFKKKKEEERNLASFYAITLLCYKNQHSLADTMRKIIPFS